MCKYFSLSLFAGVGLVIAATAQAADYSWTDRQTSPALTGAGVAVSTMYRAGKQADQMPTNAVITQVYANRRYAGNAVVHTQLCWGGRTRCVNLNGEHLNTQAFNGLDPSQPIYLIHTVSSWGQSFPPLFVVGNVNVWFTSPPTSP